MRWTASARRPLPRAATSSMSNRSSSMLWSPPFGELSRTRNNLLAWWSGRRAARQADREHRSLARFACHCHIAAHHARELARDGKAQASAAEALRSRGVGLGKFLEDFGLLLGGHADTAIGNCHLDPVASVDQPLCFELDLTLLGELAGIAQKIEQDLPEAHGIDGERAKIVRGLRREAVLVLLGQLPRGADNLVDQRREWHGLRIKLKFPSFDLRQVEHLIY